MTPIDRCRKFHREHGASPIHRLLWKCRILLPPPFFLPFWINFFLNFNLMGLIFVILNLSRFVTGTREQILDFTLPGLIVSTGGGLMMAIVQKLEANRLNLPPWKDYGSQDLV